MTQPVIGPHPQQPTLTMCGTKKQWSTTMASKVPSSERTTMVRARPSTSTLQQKKTKTGSTESGSTDWRKSSMTTTSLAQRGRITT